MTGYGLMDPFVRGDDLPSRDFVPGESSQAPKPCRHCVHGSPELCVGVDCWRCDCGCKARRHGQATQAERETKR